MTFKKHAAGMVAFGILGIGTMIAPVETSARSGGFGAAPSLSAPGAIRPSFAPQHSVHPPMPHGISRERSEHLRDFRMARRGDGRGVSGFPLWWDGAYLPSYTYGYADPYGEVPYPYPVMENFSERSRPVVIHQPGCRTDTQTVPSESGGERTINITRCY